MPTKGQTKERGRVSKIRTYVLRARKIRLVGWKFGSYASYLARLIASPPGKSLRSLSTTPLVAVSNT